MAYESNETAERAQVLAHCPAAQPADYADFSCLRAQLQRAPATWPLPPPLQGGNGDCWLLSAVTGLQCFHPHILSDAIEMRERVAVVRFPREAPVHVNYVFPLQTQHCWAGVVRISAPSDLYWALLEKAVCVLFFRRDEDACFTKRRRFGWHTRESAPHYVDLFGGHVSEALQLLVPQTLPLPVRVSPHLDANEFLRCSLSGLFFLEVPRPDGWHAVLVFARTATALCVQDSGGAITNMVPLSGGVLRYYAIPAARLEPPAFSFPHSILMFCSSWGMVEPVQNVALAYSDARGLTRSTEAQPS